VNGALAAIPKVVLVSVVVGILGGCASDPRYRQGLEWVTSAEAEKQRLEQAGFPQYSGDD